MKSTIRYILTRGDDDREIPVTVHYTAHKARPGSREGGRGLPLEPDEPAHIEIDSVTQDDNADTDIEITKREREELERECGADAYEKSFPPEDLRDEPEPDIGPADYSPMFDDPE